jgi:WS/DGAT/MGAT family acyltransferase
MSDAEAIMWAVERDPALRSDFCNLTVLEQCPSEARLHATMQRALSAFPRLRQRVVDTPLRLAPPAFADDPHLDVDTHLVRVALPAPGDHRTLLDTCARLTERPLDRDRPLWEFTLIEGLTEGRAALLQQMHHTITDGVGGLRLSLAMVDFERDPQPPPSVARTSEPGTAGTATSESEQPADQPRLDTKLDVTRAAISDATTRGIDAVRRLAGGAGRVITHPTEVPSRATDAARVMASFHRQALVTERARSDVMAPRSLERRFEAMQIGFGRARAAARALGGTINDLYVTGLAGALGRYHERLGSDVTELRLAMPISTRDRGDSAANRFVPARVLVPIQPADDPVALFAVVQARLEQVKAEASLAVAEGLAGVVSGLPSAILVAMTRSQTRTIDFAASNLRGSPAHLYLAGQRIVANYPFGPRTGTAMNVTMLSYGEELDLGFNIDPVAVSDVDQLMVDMHTSFDLLLAFGDAGTDGSS